MSLDSDISRGATVYKALFVDDHGNIKPFRICYVISVTAAAISSAVTFGLMDHNITLSLVTGAITGIVFYFLSLRTWHEQNNANNVLKKHREYVSDRIEKLKRSIKLFSSAAPSGIYIEKQLGYVLGESKVLNFYNASIDTKDAKQRAILALLDETSKLFGNCVTDVKVERIGEHTIRVTGDAVVVKD